MNRQRSMWRVSLVLAAWMGACIAQPEAQKGPERQAADQSAHFALFGQAAEAYQKLLARTPDDIEARLALAEVYYRDRKFDAAEKECKTVVGTGSPAEKALAHAILGDVYRRAGKPAEARQEYEAAKALGEGKTDEEFADANARVQRGLGVLDWENVEGERAIIYLPPDSKIKGTAARYAQIYDGLVGTVERSGGGSFEGKLEVYYFSTSDEWKSILGDREWWNDSAQEKMIYILVGRTFLNPMRTLSFYLGNRQMKEKPGSKFLTDGFAMGYCGSGTWGRRVRGNASQMKKQGKLPPLAELLPSHNGMLGASFLWYLIRAHGPEKFNVFWNSFDDDENALTTVYGKSIEEIEKEWHATIK